MGAGSPNAELGTFEMDDTGTRVTQHCYLVLLASILEKDSIIHFWVKLWGKGMKTKMKTIKLFNF